MANKPTTHPAVGSSTVRPAKAPTAQKTMANTNRWSTRVLVTIALLCAISVLLSFVEFPLLPGVAWLSYDASIMPAAVCGFAYGPAAGLACGIICLLVFGANRFMLPALIITSGLLMVPVPQQTGSKLVSSRAGRNREEET